MQPMNGHSGEVNPQKTRVFHSSQKSTLLANGMAGRKCTRIIRFSASLRFLPLERMLFNFYIIFVCKYRYFSLLLVS
jgi:hypothetical protein